MNIRDKKGAITIFVLVGLLFMTSFLIISFGSNINKSKSAKEQFNIMSSIYSHGDGDESAYERAYTAIRRKNAQILTASSENSFTLKLTKTFDDKISDYKIYGNSIQDTASKGTPSPTNPVEIQSVGDKTYNILPKAQEQTITSNGGTLTVTQEGTVEATGVPTGYVAIQYYQGSPLITKGTISVMNCGNSVNVVMVLYLYDENNNELVNISCSQSGSTNSINLDNYSTCTKWKIEIKRLKNEEMSGIFKPMIVVGSHTSAMNYEPYGKYKIPVKVSGKNLLNPNTVQDKNNYIYSASGALGTPSATGRNMENK